MRLCLSLHSVSITLGTQSECHHNRSRPHTKSSLSEHGARILYRTWLPNTFFIPLEAEPVICLVFQSKALSAFRMLFHINAPVVHEILFRSPA